MHTVKDQAETENHTSVYTINIIESLMPPQTPDSILTGRLCQRIGHRGVTQGFVKCSSAILYPDVLQDIPTEKDHQNDKSEVDPTNLDMSQTPKDGT